MACNDCGTLPPQDSRSLVTSTLKQDIVRLLREAILSGKLRPGGRVNEGKLAKQLGTSRIPVREALQELAVQGLVRKKQRRGMFVVELTDEEVHKINSVRVVLEGEALRLCRKNITPEGRKRLAELVKRMENFEALALSDVEAYAVDFEFHKSIWRYSGNNLLESILDNLLAPLFAQFVLQHMRWKIAPNEMRGYHQKLLDFVLGLSNQFAEELLLEHLSSPCKDDPVPFSSYATTLSEVKEAT